MKFYLSSGFENRKHVAKIAGLLEANQHEITFAWWEVEQWRDVRHAIITGMKEIKAVRDADAVLTFLPGGKGTHVELGVALAHKKPVVIFSADRAQLEFAEQSCPFYHLLTVSGIHLHEPWNARAVLDAVKELEAANEKCKMENGK